MERCETCLLPPFICLCADKPVVASKAVFWLLMHENEQAKATNTGYLLAGSVAGGYIAKWSRVEPDKTLLSLLSDSRYYPILVFPSAYARYHDSDAVLVSSGSIPQDKVPAFILIDATWQQARKMYNHSPYFHGLPVLDLGSECISEYQLRRVRHEAHLCTAESAIEALRWLGDTPASEQLHTCFSLFNQNFHRLKLAAIPAP
ncbi:tRNA-uridine aminocarboxypropyltransferase [Kistimonas scapharcae]|uniref:tRNA-uridine aminocarboxypropyltransferase n=1 Tax=Kistimonas scapharcae TaxID=1036133 RepID=A0ABP8V8X5_9GAMM